MEPIELTAKSPDEGRKLAAEKLGVTPDQVEVTILEETKGLFGRMSYRLSATTTAMSASATEAPAEEETPAKPKVTRSRAKKSVDDAPADAKPKVTKAAAAPKEKAEGHSEIKMGETPAAPTTDSAPRRLGRKLAPTTPEPAPATPAAAPASSDSGDKKELPARLGRKPRDEKPQTDAIPAPSAYATNDAGTKLAGNSNDEGDDVQATDEDAERYRSMLQDLLQTSGLEVELHIVDIQGKYVNLRIDDAPSDEEDKQGDASYLIGRSGEVLNALQYLANLIGKQQFSDGVRVVLDGNDWREKREEKLRTYTLEIVDAVKERGEEALLDALPAFERRIVHRIVQDIDGVQTYSEGEEPNRRVVIAPV